VPLLRTLPLTPGQGTKQGKLIALCHCCWVRATGMATLQDSSRRWNGICRFWVATVQAKLLLLRPYTEAELLLWLSVRTVMVWVGTQLPFISKHNCNSSPNIFWRGFDGVSSPAACTWGRPYATPGNQVLLVLCGLMTTQGGKVEVIIAPLQVC
jgi:hypothetical protein